MDMFVQNSKGNLFVVVGFFFFFFFFLIERRRFWGKSVNLDIRMKILRGFHSVGKLRVLFFLFLFAPGRESFELQTGFYITNFVGRLYLTINDDAGFFSPLRTTFE